MIAWRPLPLAILLMFAVTGLKLTGFAHGIWSARVVTSAVAATETDHGAAHLPPRPAAMPLAPPGPPTPIVPAEPPVSEAERSLLTDLRGRRVAIDGREQALVTREGIVAAAEHRLAARVEELQSLQTRLESLEAARRERDEANWRGLVRTYETMKPKDAAVIMAELDGPVLLQVLDRMKESKAAPILSAMPPDRARAITAQLAQLRTRATTVPPAPDHG